MSAVLERQPPIAQVRGLLRQWVAYKRRWRPDNGLPKAVCWIDEVRGAFDGWTEGEDYDSRIYAMEMRHLDDAIRSLPSQYQHAIFVVYLNEAGPAVWRSSRKPMQEIKQLSSCAEQHLIPMLIARNVVW